MLPYQGSHSSYGGQNEYELKEILKFFESKDNGKPQIIMGDLNVGPNMVWKRTYWEIEKAGYFNANVESDDPFCTFCPAENLINDYADARIIDHV